MKGLIAVSALLLSAPLLADGTSSIKDTELSLGGIALGDSEQSVLAKLGKGGRLQTKIHLDLRRLFQRLGHLDRLQPAGVGQETLLHMADEIHRLDVGGEALPHAGTDDLDRDLLRAAVAHHDRRVQLQRRLHRTEVSWEPQGSVRVSAHVRALTRLFAPMKKA